MKLVKVLETQKGGDADLIRDLLEREGIFAVVQGVDGMDLTNFTGVPQGSRMEVWADEAAKNAAESVVTSFRNGSYRDRLLREGPWKCAGCGELLEPQFTECWNCGASHDASTPAAKVKLEVASTIDFDVMCLHCRYNLRGLPPMVRCPECGMLVIRTLMQSRVRATAENIVMYYAVLAGPQELAVGMGFTLSAMLFLMDAWMVAMNGEQPPAGPEQRRVDAKQMCWAIADAATDDLGNPYQALQTLKAWGFADCRSLGKSLFTLIEHGLLEPTDRVSIDDFDSDPIESIFPTNFLSDVQL